MAGTTQRSVSPTLRQQLHRADQKSDVRSRLAYHVVASKMILNDPVGRLDGPGRRSDDESSWWLSLVWSPPRWQSSQVGATTPVLADTFPPPTPGSTSARDSSSGRRRLLAIQADTASCTSVLPSLRGQRRNDAAGRAQTVDVDENENWPELRGSDQRVLGGAAGNRTRFAALVA